MANNTVDATPTVAGYLNMLNIIAGCSTNKTDRAWARKEREKLVKLGKVQRLKINSSFDKLKEGFQYIAVRGARWD